MKVLRCWSLQIIFHVHSLTAKMRLYICIMKRKNEDEWMMVVSSPTQVRLRDIFLTYYNKRGEILLYIN